MKILITGGAGYIGSVTNAFLSEKGYETIIFDNMSRGNRDFVKGTELFIGDLIDRQQIARVFQKNDIDCVMHMASFAYVGESMENPGMYFANNVTGGINLLNAMNEYGVKKIVFSSSCSVYGTPERLPVNETTPIRPESVYAETKAILENIIMWYERQHGFEATILRYFNAAGASIKHGIGKNDGRIIPNAIKAALSGKEMKIFGNDYPTMDGTCVRDYVHVEDIANAHLLSLDRNGVYNIGYGKGISNMEIITLVEKITGRKIDAVFEGRRQGDPPEIYTENAKAVAELKWRPEHDINTIIQTAFQWMSEKPEARI